MTNSQSHPNKLPTPKQLRYLRDLALGRGQSFAYPETSQEASREIKRLLRAGRTSAAERRREVRAVRDEMAAGRSDGASVRAAELSGYGSTASWSGRAGR
jgi:hypothetical protein